MTQPRAIAGAAVKQVAAMLASAIVLVAVGEALNFALMWNQVRRK